MAPFLQRVQQAQISPSHGVSYGPLGWGLQDLVVDLCWIELEAEPVTFDISIEMVGNPEEHVRVLGQMREAILCIGWWIIR